MSLDPASVRERLDRIDQVGWDSVEGTTLLSDMRELIVRPAVRRARLRGPAGTQAESTAWAAAWMCLTGSTARIADNPAGLVSVAVRRAIWTECEFGSRAGLTGPAASRAGTRTRDRVVLEPPLSLDVARESGWEPEARASVEAEPDVGPQLQPIVTALVEVGWRQVEATAAVIALAVTAGTRRNPGLAWRRAARETGIPAWRVRRLSLLLAGDRTSPGLIESIARRGVSVLAESPVRRAMRCTVCRWSPPIEDQLRSIAITTMSDPVAG